MHLSRRCFLRSDFAGGGAWPLKAAINARCITMSGIVCRSCDDVCDARAIRFELAARGIGHPRIDLAACTGCGDCESACPVSAITLRRVEQPVRSPTGART